MWIWRCVSMFLVIWFVLFFSGTILLFSLGIFHLQPATDASLSRGNSTIIISDSDGDLQVGFGPERLNSTGIAVVDAIILNTVDLKKAYAWSIGITAAIAIVLQFAPKEGWALLLSQAVGAVVSKFVSVGTIVNLSVTIIVMVVVIVSLIYLMRKFATKLVVRMQYILAVALTLVFSVINVFWGDEGWLMSSASFYGIAFAIAIGISALKILYQWIYVKYHHCRGYHTLTTSDQDKSALDSIG